MQTHSPPQPSPAAALFLDLDGTLAEFCIRPDAVQIHPLARAALARLSSAGMAVAAVSGRNLADIDRLVAPLALPAAGVHGVERRDGHGTIHRLPDADLPPPTLALALGQSISTLPGTFLEDKGSAIALHYRAAPQHEAAVHDMAQAAVARHPQLKLQPGKFVVELKPARADKGRAIAAFLAEPPFAGRTPVFIGDDRTDEAGFAVVNAAGGLSIKVGPGQTCATYRLGDVPAVGRWLQQLADAADNMLD